MATVFAGHTLLPGQPLARRPLPAATALRLPRPRRARPQPLPPHPSRQPGAAPASALPPARRPATGGWFICGLGMQVYESQDVYGISAAAMAVARPLADAASSCRVFARRCVALSAHSVSVTRSRQSLLAVCAAQCQEPWRANYIAKHQSYKFWNDGSVLQNTCLCLVLKARVQRGR